MRTFLTVIALSGVVFAADYKNDGKALLPDPKVTPGAVLTTNKNIVCKPGYASGVRNVTSSNKRAVYAEYPESTSVCKVTCEIDHSVSLELGGSNEIQNLWPQPYSSPGAHEKDKLENWLHKAVCSGQMSLVDAQTEIRTNWVASYRKHIGPLE